MIGIMSSVAGQIIHKKKLFIVQVAVYFIIKDPILSGDRDSIASKQDSSSKFSLFEGKNV